MFLILCYDAKSKRIGRLRKTVKRYLYPVQRSVYEGFLTEGKLKQLKKELEALVDCEEDAVRIYKFPTAYGAEVERLGVLSGSSNLIL